MKITVVGTGYVGLVSGACLAEMGNDVLCLDVDAQKMRDSRAAGYRSTSPGLEALVRAQRRGRAAAVHDRYRRGVRFGTIQFIAVGTPPDEDGAADLQYVLAAARNIGRHMTDYKLVVDKSTVPVGTADQVRDAIAADAGRARRRGAVRGGLEPGVPEGRRGGRRFHAARPHHRRLPTTSARCT